MDSTKLYTLQEFAKFWNKKEMQLLAEFVNLYRKLANNAYALAEHTTQVIQSTYDLFVSENVETLIQIRYS